MNISVIFLLSIRIFSLLQQHAADIPTRGSLADVEGFTFLPPLDNAAARIPSVTTHMTQASAHSSGKSRVDLPSLSPLKQVKVKFFLHL